MPRIYTPMLEGLADHTVAEAAELALILLKEMLLHPGDPTDVMTTVAEIVDWADAHDVTRLADLTGEVAASLLRDLSGAQHLSRFQPAEVADRLHLIRNSLIALGGLTLVARTNHGMSRAQRPGNDSLAAGLPTLADRVQVTPRPPQRSKPSRGGKPRRRGRPLRDDEVMLARILAEIDLMENAPLVPIHVYLFSESGMAGMETAKAERDHLNDPHNPTTITAAGLWNATPRVVKLDPFVANVLARTLPRLRLETNQLLAYTGQHTDKSASASVTPTLDRHLARAGIARDDITARSVSLWRPDHLIRHGKLKKAVRCHGRSARHLLDELGYVAEPGAQHRKTTLLLDERMQPVALVPTRHLTAA